MLKYKFIKEALPDNISKQMTMDSALIVPARDQAHEDRIKHAFENIHDIEVDLFITRMMKVN